MNNKMNDIFTSDIMAGFIAEEKQGIDDFFDWYTELFLNDSSLSWRNCPIEFSEGGRDEKVRRDLLPHGCFEKDNFRIVIYYRNILQSAADTDMARALLCAELARACFRVTHYLYTLQDPEPLDDYVIDENGNPLDEPESEENRKPSDIWIDGEWPLSTCPLYNYQKKEILESLADYFAFIYCLGKGSGNHAYRTAALRRFDMWLHYSDTEWPCRMAYSFLCKEALSKKDISDALSGKTGRELFRKVLYASVFNQGDAYHILSDRFHN